MKQEVERLYEATDNLVNQQFYRMGSDEIVGRTPDVSVKIRMSGQIIARFKRLFMENIEYFLEGKYLEFLQPFEVIEGMDDENIEDIYEELKGKLQALEEMGPENFDIVVLYTIILSTLISKIRDHHFNSSLDYISRRIKKKMTLTDDQIQEELDNLFMRNNDNISILYNLSYIDALADSFNYSKVARICKIQKGKYINKVVDIILSKFN